MTNSNTLAQFTTVGIFTQEQLKDILHNHTSLWGMALNAIREEVPRTIIYKGKKIQHIAMLFNPDTMNFTYFHEIRDKIEYIYLSKEEVMAAVAEVQV